MPAKKPTTPKTAATTPKATEAKPRARRATAPRSPTHEQIAERAYLLHLAEHGGDAVEHWLRAERELDLEHGEIRAARTGRGRAKAATGTG